MAAIASTVQAVAATSAASLVVGAREHFDLRVMEVCCSRWW